MDNTKVIKIVGLAASALGVVASLAASWASDKKIDNEITEKVNEAIANMNKES